MGNMSKSMAQHCMVQMCNPAEINPTAHLNQASSYTDGTATLTGKYICIFR